MLKKWKYSFSKGPLSSGEQPRFLVFFSHVLCNSSRKQLVRSSREPTLWLEFRRVLFRSCNPMDCSTPGFPVLHYLSELAQIPVCWVSDAIQPSHPLPPPRVFSSESTLWIKWPKYWSFSFSISSSNEYSGLIAFRIDWFDLFAVQGTFKSLLQHHSSRAQFFSVKLECSEYSNKNPELETVLTQPLSRLWRGTTSLASQSAA